jgi:hypothetical protein
MTALTENPAVIDPLRTLSAQQRDCLLSIDFYRQIRRAGRYWHVGQKRFAVETVTSLEALGLVRSGQTRPLVVTQAGTLVIIKLKGKGA